MQDKSNILLIGSGNRDKARELAELLTGLPWDVRSLKDFPEIPEAVEDADTFEGNALIKAKYYADRFGVFCVADDSGLMVDALEGAPGVMSARYAGENCTYADNNAKLLNALREVPEAARTARFACCAVFYAPATLLWDAPRIHVEMGTVEGRIEFSPRGANGFGYDPLFVPEDGPLTFAEMDNEAKHKISHRGRAFAKLRAWLENPH